MSPRKSDGFALINNQTAPQFITKDRERRTTSLVEAARV